MSDENDVLRHTTHTHTRTRGMRGATRREVCSPFQYSAAEIIQIPGNDDDVCDDHDRKSRLSPSFFLSKSGFPKRTNERTKATATPLIFCPRPHPPTRRQRRRRRRPRPLRMGPQCRQTQRRPRRHRPTPQRPHHHLGCGFVSSKKTHARHPSPVSVVWSAQCVFTSIICARA